MTVTALLWDLDGTLVDSEPVHAKAMLGAARELHLSLPSDSAHRFLGSSGPDVHQVLVTEAGLKLDFQGWSAIKWQHYLQHANLLKPRAGIPALLQKLTRSSVRMAVFSNSSNAEVDLNLSSTNLRHYFQVVVSRADVVNGKPDPEGYLLAARGLDATPEDCVVIEDSITGARAGLVAGMQVLFYPESANLLQLCPQGASPIDSPSVLETALKSLTGA